MASCNGAGDSNNNNSHCCFMEGKVCQYLDEETVRCTIFDTAPNVEGYDESPVGRWFAKTYPGYTCRDWPQNIPEAPMQCCFEEVSD